MEGRSNRQSYGASNCGRNCARNCAGNCAGGSAKNSEDEKYSRYGKAACCERSYSSAATNGINKYDSEYTDTKTTV